MRDKPALRARSAGLAAFVLGLYGTAAGAAPPARPVSPEVLSKVSPWVLAAASEEVGASGIAAPEVPVLVLLSEQADLSGAAAMGSREEKARFVRDLLVQVAVRTQEPLLERLRAAGAPHQAFWLVNAVAVRGRRNLLLEIAARPEVLRLEGNPEVRLALPRQEPEPRRPSAAAPAEAGIVQTRAPEVWAAGVTGQGIVVGGQDTGIAWTHPALKGAYRGWNGTAAEHDFNWHDAVHAAGNPCGADSPVPCDDNLHGTHTIGTVLGLDGANQIGMAPGARWIGCRNMNSGSGSPSTYLECFQFFLAPYPVGGSSLQGDPSRAPHVTSNSWACTASEGCGPDTLRLAVAAQRAAGILSAVSTGNGGPGCSTVSAVPAIYAEVSSVGALETGTDTIAAFSSAGPVTADGSGRRKPDIAAPGTSIRSSAPGGGYATLSGTSMASPHLAGAVALLWSAQPALVGQVAQTERLLADTAAPIATTACGGTTHPNNVYGWGRLDVKAAVDRALLRPVISGFSPSTGPAAGGGTVVVAGANFVAGTVVSFGGVASPSVTVNGPGSLSAVVPAHVAGVVDVAVSNPGGETGTLPLGYRYFGAGSFYALSPCRLADTRNATGPDAAAPALGGAAARVFAVAGRCGVPATATAIAANVAVTNAAADGFLAFAPAGTVPRSVSTVNFRAGRTRANNAIVGLGPGGGTVATNGSPGTVDVILDVTGWFE